MSDTLNRIKELRISKGLNITDFAANIGVHRQRIQDIESGKVKKIQQDILLKCSEKYGVSLAWLMTGEGSMYAKADTAGYDVKEPAAGYALIKTVDLNALLSKMTAIENELKEIKKAVVA